MIAEGTGQERMIPLENGEVMLLKCAAKLENPWRCDQARGHICEGRSGGAHPSRREEVLITRTEADVGDVGGVAWWRNKCVM